MSVRLATFNVENLLSRFDFSGYRNELNQDRVLQLYDIKDENEYRLLERARVVAQTDDDRQLSALAIAETQADIICLQEVENVEALHAFEYGYLFKMTGHGFRHKYCSHGNDGRGINVAIMMREETADGEPIAFERMTSHAHLTFGQLGLDNPDLRKLGLEPHERVFRRDLLEVDIKIGGKPLTLYVTHLKSMTGQRNGLGGKEGTYPIRRAEAAAVRHVIEEKFGKGATASRRWAICADLNDYRERLIVEGDRRKGYRFKQAAETISAVDDLTRDGFSESLVDRRPENDRWTLFHSRGPQEMHLCQLDYILVSPHLARTNANTVPDIIRNGQPWRTPFPPGQAVERYPRVGWDRPKSSDHCPVAVTLDVV
jgi:endonuclease/exonuclease/phosphatase family metal-dependent hydrolase